MEQHQATIWVIFLSNLTCHFHVERNDVDEFFFMSWHPMLKTGTYIGGHVDWHWHINNEFQDRIFIACQVSLYFRPPNMFRYRLKMEINQCFFPQSI